jgi:hypothetical protein
MGRDARKKPAKRAKDGSRRGGARPNSGPKKGSQRRVRRVKDYAALGDAPTDELEGLRWMSRALRVRARQVMLDTAMSDEKRGSELRALAGAMNRLITKARLREAELLVRGESEDLKRPAADPPVGPRPGRTPPESGGT